MLPPHYSFQKGLPSERHLATNYSEEKTLTHRLINRPEENGTIRIPSKQRTSATKTISDLWSLGCFPCTENKMTEKKKVTLFHLRVYSSVEEFFQGALISPISPNAPKSGTGEPCPSCKFSGKLTFMFLLSGPHFLDRSRMYCECSYLYSPCCGINQNNPQILTDDIQPNS